MKILYWKKIVNLLFLIIVGISIEAVEKPIAIIKPKQVIARINMHSDQGNVLIPVKNCRYAPWVKGKKVVYAISAPLEEDWEPFSFSFKAKRDTTVEIKLYGPYVVINKKRIPCWIDFDNVMVSGATLKNGNFEEATKENKPKDWMSADNSMFTDNPYQGKYGLRVWHDKSATQKLELKKGQLVTVKAMARRTPNQPLIKKTAAKTRLAKLYIEQNGKKVLIDKIAIATDASRMTRQAAKEAAGILGINRVKKLQKVDNVTNALIIGKLAENSSDKLQRELKKTNNGGYAVAIKNDNILLAAKIAYYNKMGIWRFFEKLGAKIYVPGEVEKFPKHDLIVSSGWTEIPRFLTTDAIYTAPGPNGFSIFGDPRDLLWSRDLYRNAWIAHTADVMVPYKTYGKTHPEYYALLPNGKRLKYPDGKHQSMGIHLCMSNPEVQKIATENTLKWIEAQPDKKYFSISQGDGPNWCMCEKCKALDVPGHGSTDRLVFFVNKIAAAVKKKYPDKVLLISAYTPISEPPPGKYKPLDNVGLKLAPYGWGGMRSQNHSLDYPGPANAVGYNNYLGWKKLNIKTIMTCYITLYRLPLYPLANFNSHIPNLRLFDKNKNIIGIQYVGYPTQFTDMFKYVTQHLEWNPKLDENKLMKDFADAYYGKAASYMLDYVELLNKRANAPFYGSCTAYRPGLCLEGFGKKALVLFAKAKQVVAGNPIFLKRVRQEEKGLLYVYLNDLNPYANSDCDLKTFAKELQSFLAILNSETPKRKTLGVYSGPARENMMHKWIFKISGLKLKEDIYTDPLFEKFISTKAPEKFLLAHSDIKNAEVNPLGEVVPLTSFKGGSQEEAPEFELFGEEKKNVKVLSLPANGKVEAMKFIAHPIFDRLRLVFMNNDNAADKERIIQVVVNRKTVWTGKLSGITNKWQAKEFKFSPNIFRFGFNLVNIISKDPTSRAKPLLIREVKFVCKGVK